MNEEKMRIFTIIVYDDEEEEEEEEIGGMFEEMDDMSGEDDEEQHIKKKQKTELIDPYIDPYTLYTVYQIFSKQFGTDILFDLTENFVNVCGRVSCCQYCGLCHEYITQANLTKNSFGKLDIIFIRNYDKKTKTYEMSIEPHFTYRAHILTNRVSDIKLNHLEKLECFCAYCEHSTLIIEKEPINPPKIKIYFKQKDGIIRWVFIFNNPSLFVFEIKMEYKSLLNWVKLQDYDFSFK